MKKNLTKILGGLTFIMIMMACFVFSSSAATYTSNMLGNCEPYSMKHCSVETEISMGGNVYKDALLFRTGYTGTSDGHTADAKFNFNGKYNSMSFCVGYVKGEQSSGYLTVLVDGAEKEKVLLSSQDLPTKFEVNLKDVHQVIIRFDGNNGYDGMYFAVGNINLKSDGKVNPIRITSNMLNNCEPYSTKNASYYKELKMGGNTYEDVYRFRTGYTGSSDGHTADAKFNFNGNYESMSFYVGYVDGIESNGYLTVTIDGVEAKKVLLSAQDLPTKFDVNLKDVHQVVIRFDGNNGYDGMYFGLGGINLKSNGKVQGIKMLSSNINLSADNMTTYAQYVIIPCDAKNLNVIWSSSNKNVATVNNKGLITAVSGGEAVITAKTKDGNYIATCSVKVNLPVMPGKIEKINVIGNSTSAVNLSWDAVKNAECYKIYVKESTGWKAIASVASTSYTIKKLKSGTKYTFAVKTGRLINGKTIWSNDYTTIATATKAVKPSKVTATQNTSAVKLTWNKVSGATGYRIYYKSGGKWKTLVSSTTATSYTIKNLKAGTKYTFAVRPYIKTGSGVVWSSYTQTTTATKPVNPTIKVVSPSKGKVTVSWNAVKGAESYQLYYKTGNGSYKLYKTYTGAKTLNFSNLKSGTKYTFVVRAVIRIDGVNVRSGYKAVAVTVK